MIIKLKENIKDLEGKDVEGLSIGKVLANIILFDKSDPLRSYLMAQNLYANEEIDLSKADYQWIKDCVKEHGREMYTNNLVIGQVLTTLSEFKE